MDDLDLFLKIYWISFREAYWICFLGEPEREEEPPGAGEDGEGRQQGQDHLHQVDGGN